MMRSLATVGYLNCSMAEVTKNTSKLIAVTEIQAPEIVPQLYSLGTAWQKSIDFKPLLKLENIVGSVKSTILFCFVQICIINQFVFLQLYINLIHFKLQTMQSQTEGINISEQNSQDFDPLQKYYDFKDSQLYKLDVKDSIIPGSGKGLFATKHIRTGQMILEYYGSIIGSQFCNGAPFQMEDKMVYINSEFCVISRGPASRANDLVIWEPHNYDSLEFKLMRNQKKFRTHPGFDRNGKISVLQKDKAFLVATDDIKPGEQIFIDYGFQYWDFFYKRAYQNIKVI